MLEFFHFKKDIPFMRWGKVTTAISLATFLFAVWALAYKGLDFGVDFTGGTVMQVNYPTAAPIEQIRADLAHAGFKDVSVQNFGTSRDVLIRMPVKAGMDNASLSNGVMAALKTNQPQAELRSVNFVGPEVGKELYQNGSLALLVVVAGILLYLALRFEWRFALAAIIANLHDVTIILGLFAFFQWEFNLTVLAGVLAILGYSVNESVVVFDRIRENLRKMRKDVPIPDIIDNAITATMSRTVITHGSTQMMVLSMLVFGGETLHYFAMALTIGILFGIYSSVLVASPLVMWLGVSREQFIKAPKAKDPNVSDDGACV